ncbi:putative calcium-related spray [Fusarium denticulatum]|uniref:Putative calcium-related spray n=1 Tax=Fusarium denticulatum TaxID=48507 RepID=A0A8H5WC60_9HYPO|nr:putative calcium-related spray [Fusarium denticulatum]
MWSCIMKPLAVLASVAALASPVFGEKILYSNSLNSCQKDNGFKATLFNVALTPNNGSAFVKAVATSSIQGKVIFDIRLSAYGYQFLQQTVDPCTINLAGLCPMVSGKIPFKFNLPVGKENLKQVPGIAYSVPDLDATVRVYVNMSSTGESVACVEADFSNGKTVDLKGVKWATAIIAGLGLISSAVVSGVGHANTAAHVASNSLSLFGYFQAQAILGLTSVGLPPIVSSWTQDFQWSMGIIRVGFMQDIFTWYQRATGGTPESILYNVRQVSVEIQKRSLQAASTSIDLFKRSAAMMPRSITEPIGHAAGALAKRANIQTEDGTYIVYGIQRVAFKSRIETTNLFMTGLTFFCIFVVITCLAIAAFKGVCELCVRQKWMAPDKFLEFRNGWMTVLKGILFRLTLIGFPQMVILCLWEFTQQDSPAEVVLAVFFLLGMTFTLAWGASKVIRIARRSVAMHRNPAYILFSDPQALNKWGFLYVQFRASAYYFIVPVLVYTVVKAMFVALAQKNDVAQAVGFIIIEVGFLIAASVLRPWMDKPTNSFNIAIAAINFINAIFLLIFSNVFGLPKIVVGVVGVVLFVLNAAFALILLLMLIVSTALVFFRKNPDARYQFMADDRASFMKSQTQVNATTELDALAATARGDKAGYSNKHLDLDEEDSMSSESLRRRAEVNNQSQTSFQRGDVPPRSPVNPAMPLFPADGQRPASPFRNASPNPYQQSTSNLSQQRSAGDSSPGGYRSQNNASPWQRGAGYEH